MATRLSLSYKGIRRSRAAASLKVYEDRTLLEAIAGIRRSRAAASLKAPAAGRRRRSSTGYPPLAGGGLIEGGLF